MSNAKRCDRCQQHFEPAVSDLVIVTLHEYVKPPEDEATGKLWERAIADEDSELDFCTTCSTALRNFLNEQPPK